MLRALADHAGRQGGHARPVGRRVGFAGPDDELERDHRRARAPGRWPRSGRWAGPVVSTAGSLSSSALGVGQGRRPAEPLLGAGRPGQDSPSAAASRRRRAGHGRTGRRTKRTLSLGPELQDDPVLGDEVAG
ncbi:MAG: hypothetical protein MZV70_66785 [Desulfobacterales bacterium]|nr:hypothetical protein [Desulfobacterales bacterium]